MKIKINLLVIVLVAITIGMASGCGNTAGNNAVSNQNTANTAANTNQATTTPVAADPPSTGTGTPTDAYRAAYAARNNKDVPALKKLLSKDIIEFFTEISGLGDKPQTLDELLMELCEKPQAATPDARNEKITGDKATLEYLDEEGKWSTMDFIIEDGMWKLTIPMPEDGAPPVNDGPGKKKNKNS
ncbi:MAG: hypothetical protein WBO10_00730 [Pyrinomonadaceae bacterium]